VTVPVGVPLEPATVVATVNDWLADNVDADGVTVTAGVGRITAVTVTVAPLVAGE
jgi:hypothetical protein